jgi:hypothetical protein
MEARVKALEDKVGTLATKADVSDAKSSVVMWGVGIGLALVAALFVQFRAVDTKVDTLGNRLDTKMDATNQRLDRMTDTNNARLDRVSDLIQAAVVDGSLAKDQPHTEPKPP